MQNDFCGEFIIVFTDELYNPLGVEDNQTVCLGSCKYIIQSNFFIIFLHFRPLVKFW